MSTQSFTLEYEDEVAGYRLTGNFSFIHRSFHGKALWDHPYLEIENYYQNEFDSGKTKIQINEIESFHVEKIKWKVPFTRAYIENE